MKKWFVEFQGGAPKRANAMRVYCFACAGGSVVDFRALDAHFPANLRAVGCELPGHMTRIDEPGLDSIELCGSLAAEAIAAAADSRPFALLGHSLGGLVALEACRALEVMGRAPAALVICATDPPHGRGGCVRRFAALAAVGDAGAFVERQAEEFRESKLREFYLAQPSFAEPFVRTMQRDVRLLAAYADGSCDSARFAGRVHTPLHPLYGRGDPGLDADEMREWDRYTTARVFPVAEFDGGHHFVKTNVAPVAEHLASVLLQ